MSLWTALNPPSSRIHLKREGTSTYRERIIIISQQHVTARGSSTGHSSVTVSSAWPAAATAAGHACGVFGSVISASAKPTRTHPVTDRSSAMSGGVYGGGKSSDRTITMTTASRASLQSRTQQTRALSRFTVHTPSVSTFAYSISRAIYKRYCMNINIGTPVRESTQLHTIYTHLTLLSSASLISNIDLRDAGLHLQIFSRSYLEPGNICSLHFCCWSITDHIMHTRFSNNSSIYKVQKLIFWVN